jgi:hypothetical protein
MVDSFKPLQHHDAENTDDDTLKRDARAHVAKWPHLQVMAEMWIKLRQVNLPWWTTSFTREQWRPASRMQWLQQRADVRQRVTSQLTGLPKNAARSKPPEFQASLIDAVLEHGDATDTDFEDAFTAQEMVVYGPVADVWTQFRARMPWEDDSPVHQKLVGWLLRVLTTERCTLDGEMTRRPILTAWDVRAAIDPRVWQERVPTEVRVAIDEARLKHEKSRPREPFQARHELLVATPEILATNIPLVDLVPVIQIAERGLLMANERGETPRESGAFELSPVSTRMGIGAVDVPAISVRPLSAIAR